MCGRGHASTVAGARPVIRGLGVEDLDLVAVGKDLAKPAFGVSCVLRIDGRFDAVGLRAVRGNLRAGCECAGFDVARGDNPDAGLAEDPIDCIEVRSADFHS